MNISIDNLEKPDLENAAKGEIYQSFSLVLPSVCVSDGWPWRSADHRGAEGLDPPTPGEAGRGLSQAISLVSLAPVFGSAREKKSDPSGGRG